MSTRPPAPWAGFRVRTFTASCSIRPGTAFSSHLLVARKLLPCQPIRGIGRALTTQCARGRVTRFPQDGELYEAWRADDVDGIGAALRAGADANATFDGMPLIMYAVGNDLPDLVHELLELGANVDAARHPGGETALMFAVSFGSKHHQRQIRDTLLEHGANINATDNKGNSVLDLAVASERLEDAESLVSKAARGSKRTAIELERLRARQDHKRR